MKTNTIILTTTLIAVFITAVMSCSMWRKQTLIRHLNTHAFYSALTYDDMGLNLIGDSLVFYHVTHPDFPSFNIRRLQITDTVDSFEFDARGLRASLPQYFHLKQPFAFKRQLHTYTPVSELLTKPLITLSVLGYDTLEADVSLKANLIAPDQILCHLTFTHKGQVKAHFTARLKPQYPKDSVFKNLIANPISMKVTHLDQELKMLLDDYCLSKGIPVLTDNQSIPFSF